MIWLNSRSGSSLKINPRTKANLIEKYREDIRETAELTGLDLSNWLR